MPHRFRDQQKRLDDFAGEVWVVCPACASKAIATLLLAQQEARLTCAACGYHKTVSRLRFTNNGLPVEVKMPAHSFFEASLWLSAPFRNHVFWAYNDVHLAYLEAYIGATLREHTDRTHFTLLEKLPRFYHEARNREPLLKLISRLKTK